jgi:hypothetical protein
VPYIAFGRVAGWGQCCEHTRGFRSQHARPISPVFLDGRVYPPAAGLALARLYNVAVFLRQGALALPVDRLARAYEQVRHLPDPALARGMRVGGFEVILPPGLGERDLVPWTSTPQPAGPPFYQRLLAWLSE